MVKLNLQVNTFLLIAALKRKLLKLHNTKLARTIYRTADAPPLYL